MLQNNHHNLAEYLSDFYRYLTMQDGVNAHSRTNYISWLKFLDSQGYALEQLNSQDDIMDILANEKLLQKDREGQGSQQFQGCTEQIPAIQKI